MTSIDQPDASKVKVGAVVLAAGQSRRMGQPKMLLPWKDGRTVIEQVVKTLLDSEIHPVVVVTGAQHDRVAKALSGMPVTVTYNGRFADHEMVTSLQVGLREISPDIDGVLIVLGDQPAISGDVVRVVAAAFSEGSRQLVVPSYQMRRGHPWLVSRSLWKDLLSLSEESSLRDFLAQHVSKIFYLTVDTPAILKDMDTPEDYRRLLEEE